MTYEDLLQEASDNNLIVKEKRLRGYEGRIKGNRIAIKKDMTETAKGCALSEELGHYHVNAGNIIDLSDIRNAKQEHQARLWAYNRQIGLTGIVQAFKNKCTNLHEMADFLNVTEEFLQDALTCYKNKYGVSVKIDNYIIYFEPNLYVMKLFE